MIKIMFWSLGRNGGPTDGQMRPGLSGWLVFPRVINSKYYITLKDEVDPLVFQLCETMLIGDGYKIPCNEFHPDINDLLGYNPSYIYKKWEYFSHSYVLDILWSIYL